MWERISIETNVELLSGLLWMWIENLSEPILGRQSIIYIVLKADKPIDGLLKLDMVRVRSFCVFLIVM